MSKICGLYPESLVLRGIKLLGSTPVAAGSYGDVFTGQFHNEIVAVKVFRIYQRSDVNALLQVYSMVMNMN
jgi:predicted unusual protein kinase regulating ubiquinone biosynthesis (AarF/ABC1/UbiB family)